MVINLTVGKKIRGCFEELAALLPRLSAIRSSWRGGDRDAEAFNAVMKARLLRSRRSRQPARRRSRKTIGATRVPLGLWRSISLEIP
jgi:formiminotetrahydrofolate cyclodeaminase